MMNKDGAEKRWPAKNPEKPPLYNPDGNSGTYPNIITPYLISPFRLLLIILGVIFLAEVLIMTLVTLGNPLSPLVTIFIDAGIITILAFPVLYFLSFRPLLNHIEKGRQSEEALLRSWELQERFFDSIDILTAYMDRNFNFIRVNDAYAKADGRQPEYFIGKNHFDLYPHAENQAIFQQVVETGEAYIVYEKPFEYPDQPERGITYWDWNLQPVRSVHGEVYGVVLSLVDVTERKLAEEKAEIERARLRSILDTMPDGVYIVSQQFEVEYANPVVERDFGPVECQKCYAHFYDRNSPCEWCKNPAVFQGERINSEWYSSKTGKIYEVFDSPLTNLNGSVSKLKFLHDITNRKQTAEEMERQNLELKALSTLERKQRHIAETLCASTQALTRILDIDTILKTLLEHISALLNTDIVSIGFVEDEIHLVTHNAQGFGKRTGSDHAPIFTIDAKTDPFFQKVATSYKSLLVHDATQDPDWINYPGSEPIRSWLGVPILVSDKVIGAVLLGKNSAGFFAQEHTRLAEALVSQAAVTIQNAWLFEQVRAGRERLQLLSRRLVEIQEAERTYIARELHDQAGQSLTSLIIGLGQLEKRVNNPSDAKVKTSKLKFLANDILEDLHRLAVDLRPASLDHLGLVPALEQLVNSLIEDNELNVEFKAIGLAKTDRLPSTIESTLYRIVQEALTNVTRHAQATRADVILERRDDAILVIVEDDGIGFDATLTSDNDHLGLIGIRERAEMLGGILTIESIIGSGTTLVVEVPNANTHSAG